MNAQTLSAPASTCHFPFALPVAELPSARTVSADPRDYGFDFDEEELGRELLAPSPIADRFHPEVDADEFEACYTWFLA